MSHAPGWVTTDFGRRVLVVPVTVVMNIRNTPADIFAVHGPAAFVEDKRGSQSDKDAVAGLK